MSAEKTTVMENITVWNSPGEMVRHLRDDGTYVDSSYGKVNYREWCELELARMGKNRGDVKIVERADGCIALAR